MQREPEGILALRAHQHFLVLFYFSKSILESCDITVTSRVTFGHETPLVEEVLGNDGGMPPRMEGRVVS